MHNKTQAAYLLIDMEQGFVNPAGGHCIKGAAATVPAVLRLCRRPGIKVWRW